MTDFVGVSISVTPIGIVLGSSYIVILVSIFWWMLHVPEAGGAEQKAERTVREASSFARIMVPVQGTWLSDRMVALGCQIARYRDADLSIVYVVEVPLTLPRNAAMPDEERNASDAFRRAKEVAERYRVRIRTDIFKTRQAGPGIVQYSREGQYDLILMGDHPRRGRGTEFARSVEYVFEHANCEVIIDRPPKA